MKPMFSYMGSKWLLSKKYGAPTTKTVVEPFAGGACYSLYWNVPHAILFDLNPTIAGIWSYLIRVHESEILALPTEFEMIADLKIPQEAKDLIGFWAGKGRTTPGRSRSAWGRQFNDATTCRVWGTPVRQRIASQLTQIRQWEVRCADYRECSDIIADWFIDPPYSVAGKNYPFSTIEYSDLASFCLARKGRITVCENRGASWLPFVPFSTVQATKGKNRKAISEEVVYQKFQ